jgi:hypothetical protein
VRDPREPGVVGVGCATPFKFRARAGSDSGDERLVYSLSGDVGMCGGKVVDAGDELSQGRLLPVVRMPVRECV